MGYNGGEMRASLGIVLCAAAFVWQGPASAGVIEPASRLVDDEKIVLAIVLTNGQDPPPASMDFAVLFDAGKVRYREASLGASGQAAGKRLQSSLNTPGRLRVVIRGLNTHALASGEAARVVFTPLAQATGSTEFAIDDPALASASGERIPAAGGRVGVELASSPRTSGTQVDPVNRAETVSPPQDEPPTDAAVPPEAEPEKGNADLRSRLDAILAEAKRLRGEVEAAADKEVDHEEDNPAAGAGKPMEEGASDVSEAAFEPVPYINRPKDRPSPIGAAVDKPKPGRPFPASRTAPDSGAAVNRAWALAFFFGLGALALLILTRRWFIGPA